MRSVSTRLLAVCVALPAIVSLVFLLIVSVFVFGHAFRPGLYAEVVLVLYASLLLLQFQRGKVRAAIFNTLLLLAFYGACLMKLLLLREGIALTDFEGIDELFVVMSMWQRSALVVATGALMLLLLTNLTRPRLLPTILLLLPLAGYFIGSSFAPATVRALFEVWRPTSVIVELEPWRDGPLVTVARQLPRMRVMREFMQTPPNADDLQRRARAAANLPPPRRNVHIVLMESFVDPLNFRALRCPFDPVDVRFRRWVDESESLALAATFGGKSSRSEFELLCGVPAFERLGIDFLALGSAELPCLPNLLRRLGYATISSSTGSSSFFNHDTAYTALGFERRYFAPDFVMEEGDMDGEVLSDAAYYPQMLERILPAIDAGKPLLTYVITWAGHHPFDLNPQRRPPVCPEDMLAGKVSNCSHYNSTAAADYIEQIESHDPEALIVVLADHLPPLGFAHSGYREADYRLRFRGREAPSFWATEEPSWLESRATTLIVRKARRPVSLGVIPHYLIPEAILDLLTEGAYCRATTCFRTLPIINRPHGVRPVFTTPDAFPLPVCASEADAGNALCRDGAHMQHQLEVEYDALLRAGVTSP